MSNQTIHFSGYFPDGSRSWKMAVKMERVSRCQNVSVPHFIGAKDDGGGSDNWIYKTSKAPVKLSPPTNQHPVFTGRMPFLSPSQRNGLLILHSNFATSCYCYCYCVTPQISETAHRTLGLACGFGTVGLQ